MARIVFDLDGTLLDSAPDICLAGNLALEGTGAAPMEVAEAREYVGSGAGVFVERMRIARGLPERTHAGLLARFLDAYEGAVHRTEVYPGVVAALGALRDAGHALGICTNKPIAPTRAVLAHFELTGFFAAMYGGDSLPVRKPDPAPLHAAVQALGEGPALFVGDSEVDAQTGDRAGVPTLIFTPGYRKAPLDALPHAGAFDHWYEMPGLAEAVLGCVGAGNGNRTRN
ncbi:phosphoglycolate phosphatase [Gymnodinialimonas ulvae]|uniref:phosphoglycolate phosphatase n=1 Tax=Gymnodinialimonas ulvae TaxID=3126504 RepID=UPI0030AAD187